MTAALRVVDTGLNPACWNVAMTAAMTELHREGRMPDMLRFHRYPRSVLIGRHEALQTVVDLPLCRTRGIAVARRITGGGAVYMSPGVLAWEIFIDLRTAGGDLDAVANHMGEAVAGGLVSLGVAARYRAPNDIEVDGRKICGACGYVDGATVVYQGAVLIDADLAEMVSALALPVSVNERLTTVGNELKRSVTYDEVVDAVTTAIAERLSRRLESAEVTADEQALAETMLVQEIGDDAFIDAVDPQRGSSRLSARLQGGGVAAHVRVHPGVERRIDQIWLTGPFSLVPERALPDLEAALRGTPLESAASRALAFLDGRRVAVHGASRIDIAAAIDALASETTVTRVMSRETSMSRETVS
jgi:lipoate-protein ligase A